MLTTPAGWQDAIKSSVRQLKAKVVLKYATPLTLEGDKVIAIEVTSKGEKELGCIQDDIVSVSILGTSISDDQFNQQIDCEVWIGVKLVNDYSYVKTGEYASLKWNKNDLTKVVTIDFCSKINMNAIITENVVDSNVTLKNYIPRVFSSLFGSSATVDSGVLDATLAGAYLYHERLKEQLTSLAMACNGIIRYNDGYKVTPYKRTAPCLTLKTGQNEALFNVIRQTDYTNQRPQVSILKSFFAKSEVSSIFSSGNINLPASASGYPIEINLGYPVIPKYFSFKKYGYLSSYKVGITKSTVYINNGYDTPRSLSLEVFGVKIVSTVIGEKEKDGSIKYIENPYIQTDAQVNGLDKRIYTGIEYRCKYKGNPSLQVGDTVAIEGVGDVLITSHTLTFSGGMEGIIEGVCISG